MIVEIAKSNKTPVKKLVVKPSPLQKSLTSLGAGQHQQIIVLPSNLLLNSNKDQPTVLRLASSSPTAAKIVHVSSPKSAVVGLKRPIPKIEVEDDNDSVSGEPTRKRANLDHLTPEEKLMRRKLKNRVAAQNARDKKRVKMDDMEAKMKELEAENARIMSENASLKALNNRLMEENQVLSQPFGTTKLVPDSVVLQQQQEQQQLEGRMLPTPPPSECPSSPPESLAAAEHGPVDLRSFESAAGSGSNVGRLDDSHVGDDGADGILSGGDVSGGGNLLGVENLSVQEALNDLERLLFEGSQRQHGADSVVTIKEENPSRSASPANSTVSSLMTSWDGSDGSNDDTQHIKTEEPENEDLLGFDINELFPDLAVAEAGIDL